jgi:3',5'-cyclic AMP phosphodiesterase CpdA
MKIAHVSDLHLSGSHFVSEWGENLLDVLGSTEPDLVVISGDLTDEGHPHEYDLAKSFVDRIGTEKKILVPGNHDARNAGYTIFEEIFGTRFPYYEDDKVVILGLDSTVPDLDDGHIGRENYQMMTEKLSVEGKMRILTLHHHLIAIPGTGRERNIAVDAGQVLRLCSELDVDFVISGHRHLPWVWKLQNTYYVTAGTATSRRLKGRTHPSFNVMEIEEGQVVMKEINVADKSSREILKV